MPIEVKILAYAAVLLLVHIFAAAHFKTKQYGSKWNTGARDETLEPLNAVAGRLARAQNNFAETLPIAIIALLGIAIADRSTEWTVLGGWIWLGARVLYLPIYGFGVPVIRTFIFLASLVGLGMVIWPLLAP